MKQFDGNNDTGNPEAARSPLWRHVNPFGLSGMNVSVAVDLSWIRTLYFMEEYYNE